jgi:hypothetical protein
MDRGASVVAAMCARQAETAEHPGHRAQHRAGTKSQPGFRAGRNGER